MKGQARLIVFEIVELNDFSVEGVVGFVGAGVFDDDGTSDSLEALFDLVVEGDFIR